MNWNQYRRKGFSEMRPYVPGEDMTGISVSATDTPEEGGMVARNPKDHADQWYVAKKYFVDNLEEVVNPLGQELLCGGFSFGTAIELAKNGNRIARAGWNGKDMFVVYQPGYPEGIPCNANTAAAFGYELGELFKCRPYLQMRCADGTHQMWLASQSDILEEDWVIV